MRLLGSDVDIRTISPLTLAFIGDAVYDLLVRELLVCEANRPVGVLNEKKIKLVCCEFQSEAAKKLMPTLTDEELAAFKRGKNANSTTVPKHASRVDYHNATGLEALFGYLYLTEQTQRLGELFNIIISSD